MNGENEKIFFNAYGFQVKVANPARKSMIFGVGYCSVAVSIINTLYIVVHVLQHQPLPTSLSGKSNLFEAHIVCLNKQTCGWMLIKKVIIFLNWDER